MKSYLIYHHKGTIYQRNADQVLHDLHDMLRHAIEDFNETGDVKHLLKPQLVQYRNSIALDDHDRPDYTAVGVKKILELVMDTRFAPHRYYDADILDYYEDISHEVDMKWRMWMEGQPIG